MNAKTVVVWAVLCGALLLGGCPQTQVGEQQGPLDQPGADEGCPSAQEVFAQTVPATYLVAIEYRLGPGENDLVSIPIATAFGIAPDMLATNAHVVEATLDSSFFPVERVLAAQSGTNATIELVGAVVHPAYEGNPLRSPDVGILRTAEDLPAFTDLPSADARFTLASGDELFLSGFPGDVNTFLPIRLGITVPQATSLSGAISALRSFDATARVTRDTIDILQHQLPTSPGTSGSPLVHCGEVVAVHNAGTAKLVISVDAAGNPILDRNTAASNNFGLHVKYLRELVAMVGDGSVTVQTLPPPMPESSPIACDTAFYNADWRVGFDPPAGFARDRDGCTTSICLACWSDEMGGRVIVYGEPGNPLGLQAAVDGWIAFNAGRNAMLLTGVNTLRLANGAEAIRLGWYIYGSSPWLDSCAVEVWVESTAGTVTLTWLFPAIGLDAYAGTIEGSSETLCVD